MALTLIRADPSWRDDLYDFYACLTAMLKAHGLERVAGFGPLPSNAVRQLSGVLLTQTALPRQPQLTRSGHR